MSHLTLSVELRRLLINIGDINVKIQDVRFWTREQLSILKYLQMLKDSQILFKTVL